MQRSPALQDFLDRLERALMPRLTAGTAEEEMAAGLFARLATPVPAEPSEASERPAPEVLGAALRNASTGSADLAALAEAFGRLEPELPWRRGRRTPGPGEPLDLHVTIVGSRGLEKRSDGEIGVSLLEPHCTYVDHHHPPDEVYLVLSPGEWRQGRDPWFAPGLGGTVYNPPDILHNMRSFDAPLFAVWCLPGW